jgi:hypothetical protein
VLDDPRVASSATTPAPGPVVLELTPHEAHHVLRLAEVGVLVFSGGTPPHDLARRLRRDLAPFAIEPTRSTP